MKKRRAPKNETLYRLLFDSSGDAIFVHPVAEDGMPDKFIEVNETACRRLGYSKEELLKMSPEDIDDPQTFKKLNPRFGDILLNGQGVFETIHITKDGRKIPVEINVHLFEINGQKTALSIARDITDRKEMQEELAKYQQHLEKIVFERTDELRKSEARYRHLVEMQQDTVCRWLPDTTLTFVNEGYCNFFGKNKDELLGMKWLDLVPESSRKTVEKFYRELALKPKSHRYEHEVVNAKGEVCWQEWIDSPVFDICGMLVEFQSVGRDITERKKMQEEIKTKQAQLIHADRMASLGLMASGIAHEINNPNNYILATAQIVVKVWEDAKRILEKYQKEHGDFSLGGFSFNDAMETIPSLLSGLIEGSWRIKTIVDSLREFIRPESRGSFAAVDVNKAVNAAVSIMRHMIERHTSKFELNLGSDAPEIKGSAVKIEQVIVNLLMNALQALPDREHAVELSTVFDEKAKLIKIMVKDEGIGIPAEHMNRLTEPFFSTKFDTGGSGLGLFISHYIITEHGGSMEFESEHGKGTTVTVKLPVGL